MTVCGNMIQLWNGLVYVCKKPRGHNGPHADGNKTWAQKPVRP